MSDQTGHSKRSTLWTLASVASALSLPSLLWLGQPFWQLPLDLLSPLLLLALGHTLVLLTTSFGGRTTVSRLGISILLLLAVFGFAYGYQWLRPDVSFSRVVGGLWLLLSITLLVAGHMLRGGARLAATALLAVAIGYALLPRARPAPEHALATDATPVAPHEQLLVSAYYPLGLTVHEDIVDPADVQSGGGIAALGDGLIAMTGGGAFYRLAWNPDSKTVDHHRLPLESPTNAEAFDAAMPQFVIRDWFRTHDLVTRRAGDRWEVFVSHHVFDEARRCVQVVVSRAALNDGLDVVDVNWQELYRLEPCLPTAGDTGVENFAGLEAGGRLAWLDSSQLILTAGDHQFDGWNRATIAAQDPSYDYGKTLVIDVSTGRARRLTYGHRNPQGLWVDADRSIWTTEHGPQGGDELNLLVEGGNYGWPYITYGTESNRLIWPPEEAHSDPVSSIDPVYAWVPSIGISNLIRVNGAPFARWKGHFLIGSLKGTTLYRLELVEGHVAYAEPIPVGRRIRDLIEGPDGRIWLWGDRGELMTIAVMEDVSRGEVVFAGCDACHPRHQDHEGRGVGAGPNLDNIIGRPVASGNYQYSAALKALGGTWTEERLDAFLADPGAFAPGTLMTYRLPDPADRAALIAFLRDMPLRF